MLRNLIPSGFEFGIQVPGCHLKEVPSLHPFVFDNFNTITPGGNFRVRRIFYKSDEGDFELTDWFVDWMKDRQMKIHGHCLLHAPHNFLRWRALTNLELENTIKNCVQSIVSRYKGAIDSWDVIGEFISPRGGLTNNFWVNRLGPAFCEKMFRWVRAANPDATLYYSDYGLESANKLNSVLIFSQFLQGHGIPIDGISLQFHHYTKGAVRLGQFKKAIGRFQALGFRTRISEATIWQDKLRLGDAVEKIQAFCYGKLLDAAIATGCEGITFWTPFDGYVWRDGDGEPGLWDDLLNPKPALNEIERVLRQAKKKGEDSPINSPSSAEAIASDETSI